MRFHILGLAHTQTTAAFSSCAYTQKARGLARMLHERGHEVYLYSGDENDAPCTEHISCISEKTRKNSHGDKHFGAAVHSADALHWRTFNLNAVKEITARAHPQGDFLCITFGYAQKPVMDMLPMLRAVESGVGYHATMLAPNRVFESYAWMHSVYAAHAKTSDRDGVWFDDVIHPYFDPDQFEVMPKSKKGYLLYLGRMIRRKGVFVAAQIAEATGRQLIGAGAGNEIPKNMHYLGEVGPERRKRLLARAHAVLMPTEYIEPGGNVAIEAMASGTPVITTDWGVFTETVVNGFTGYRCRVLQEFVDAVTVADVLDPALIRQYAIDNFSLNATAAKYERFFKRVQLLWKSGWPELRKENTND